MAPVWVWMRGAGLQVVGQTVGPNVRWDKLLVQMYGRRYTGVPVRHDHCCWRVLVSKLSYHKKFCESVKLCG